MLLKIQEFSDFCGLSVRALHLYDKIGLFTPITIDKSNGYRYYDTDQMLELNTIASFKKIGLSLNDLKEIKGDNYPREMIVAKLKEKKKENLKQMEIIKCNNQIMDEMLTHIESLSPSAPDIDNKIILKALCLENEKLDSFFSEILWL